MPCAPSRETSPAWKLNNNVEVPFPHLVFEVVSTHLSSMRGLPSSEVGTPMNAAAAGSCTRALAFRLTVAGAAAEAETSEVDRALSLGSFAYDVGNILGT